MLKLLRRLQYFVRQRRLEAELREEIETHRALRQQDLKARGADEREAQQAARKALGNVTLAREDARAVWVPPSVESIGQDVRYALRSLIRQPGFTAVAAGTIAIAVGLNTSLFTVFSALALRPWPVPEPERVVRALTGPGGHFSSAALAHFSTRAKTFEGLFAVRMAGNNVIGEDGARVAWVSGDYFRVLQVPLALGRPFVATDDASGAPAVAILSYGYWQRRFGSDVSIVGRNVEIEAMPVTVLGVASRAFTGTSSDRTDLWMPLSNAAVFRPTERWVRDEILRPGKALGGSLMLAGRLAPGVTRQQAEAELTLLAASMPDADSTPPRVRLEDTTFFGGPKGAGTSDFPRIFGATALVLLLACANVGNLLLARGAARRREVAVRLSLGASRPRVVRQLLTESLVLALGAGAAGLVLAAFLPQPIVELLSDRPTALQLQPDSLVLAFALLLSVGAALFFGLAPALHATRTTIGDALKDAPPLPASAFSLRAVLLTAQVALSVVLLVAAALLLRGVAHARGIDHGFDVDAVTVISFDVPRTSYDAPRTKQFSRDLEEALAVVGDEPMALTQTVPFGSGTIKGSFRRSSARDAKDEGNAVYDVSPGYFETLGVPLVAGRLLLAGDTPGTVVVVNEALARLLGSPASVVGRRIHVPADNGWNVPGNPQIVGVVRDAHTTDFLAPSPTLYQPYSGRSVPVVITRAPVAAALERVGTLVSRLDPRVRLRSAPLITMVDARLRGTRTFAILASSVGLVALVLATVGMFGVFAFWVQQRRHEIGIRMALGATRARVMRGVLLSSAPAIAIGLALGYAAAAAASGLLRSSLFGLSPLDPLAYLSVMLLITNAALLATVVPARRAAAVDPVVVLRQE
jgi:predicted permease